jgi:hypothetical protein
MAFFGFSFEIQKQNRKPKRHFFTVTVIVKTGLFAFMLLNNIKTNRKPIFIIFGFSKIINNF